MKNIQAQYQDLLEGKMSMSNFMRSVRMQFPQHISPTTSYDDSVKILKGKRILSEAKKPEGVYGHNPNAENDTYRGIDHLNYYQVYHGIQYELAKMPEITDENYVKARKKVVDTILKDPDAYKQLQLANFKAVKEMDEDLEMKDVKKNNLKDKPNEMKVVKKDEKGNTQDTLEKKEKKKAKNGKGLQHMTQTPKGKLEAFATPGKEKTLKEGLNEGDTSYRDKATIDGTTISVGYDNGYGDYTLYFPQIEMYNDRGVADQVLRVTDDSEKAKEYFEKAKELARDGKDVYDIYKELEKQRMKDRGFGENKEKVMALKEHIIDEMTTPNPHHEDFHKGMEVHKKKGGSGPGKIIEFDGHTATVQWEDGSVEDLQKNVITKQPPAAQTTPSENPFSKMPDLGKLGQDWLSKQNKEELDEDPVGQQAAGDEEEEASLRATVIKREDRDSMLKKLKERLVKALQKEAGDVVTAQDGTVLAVTPPGQGRNAALSIKNKSKGGINATVTSVKG